MPLSEDTDLRILHARASDVQEEMLKELLAEIDSIRGCRLDGQQVIQFLEQSILRPNGMSERKPFEKTEVFDKRYLVEKIGKLSGSGIYQLCTELVALRQGKTGKPDHIENHDGKRVYTFLNSVFPREVKKRRR